MKSLEVVSNVDAGVVFVMSSRGEADTSDTTEMWDFSVSPLLSSQAFILQYW